jgi:hypothetical protein
MLTFYLSRNFLDGDDGDQVWNAVCAALQQSWNTSLNLEGARSGLIAATHSPLTPLAVFRDASQIIAERFGLEAKTKYPATMIVDTGKSESLVARVEEHYKRLLKPWELYASPSAFDEMRVDLDKSVDLTFDEIPDYWYGLLRFDEDEHFLFAKALVRGAESPCFYCGSRKHTPTRCPSKQLFASREAIETLGRSSLSHANSCFLRYLTCPEIKIETLGGNQHSDSRNDLASVAHRAFYDIKQVFQLRFFRLFFGADHLDWERIRNSKGLHSQGGATWLALDCLRVGDLDKAEHYVEIGMEHDPGDWKPVCILGFLSIENDGLGKAEYHFEKALDLSRRIPQRILLNLLLARVNYLNQEPRKAREYARSALLLDRWCQDALYSLIALDFDLTKNEQPLQGLERLARQNGYYWMCAFIDPDLASHSADIHPCLSRIAAEARHEAELLWLEAQREFRGVRTLLGTDSKILHEAQDLASSLDNKPNQDGYLDSTERLHGARVLKALCQKALEEQKQELKKGLNLLRARIDEVNRIAGGAQGDPWPGSIEALNALRTRIENARRNAAIDFVNTYQDFMAKRETYITRLNEIERGLKTWRTRRQLCAFLVSFLIRTSGFLFATFTFALLFPFLMGAAQAFCPQFRVSMDDYGPLQRVFIVLGVMTSLAIAAVSGYSKVYAAKRRDAVPIKGETQPNPLKKHAKVGWR